MHDASKLRALDDDAVKLLSRPHGGVTMVTLAPETHHARLSSARSSMPASSSPPGTPMPRTTELQPALAAGLRGFTHLFNAMSQLGNREPGAVGAALAHDASWCGLIVDGHHVHPEVLKIALRAKRHDRFMLVTDAMPSVGAEAKDFVIQGRPITVNGDKIVDDEGRLAGAHLDMASAVRNTVRMLGVSLVDAVRMASAHPAEFLTLRDVGHIAPGQRANLVRLDADYHALETWIDGKSDPDRAPAAVAPRDAATV